MIFRWLQQRWWASQRDADIQWLWPQCKIKAPTLDEAHQIFMMHAINQPCWVMHYGEELWSKIQELK